MQTAALELILKLKDQASQGLQAIRSALGGVGERARSVAGSLATFLGGTAVAGTLAFGGAIAGAGAAGLSFNNSMEMVTAQLNAFTKDGAKSAEILEMIKDRASKTPFEFEQMAQAATALLPASKASGVALEDLIAKAEILAASNPAQGLEGAAFSLKEALSGDFTSIIERFNLPRQRLNELKEQGVPALEAVQIAMQELGLDADLVSNLANTASGRWSTLKDTFVGLASTVTQPLFERVSASLAGLNDWITANQPLLDSLAATLADRVGGAIDFLAANAIPAFQVAWANVQPLIEAGQGALDRVQQALALFGETWAIAGEGASGLGDQLGATIDLLTGADGTFTRIGQTAQAAFGQVLSAVQPVTSAFQSGGLGGALQALPGAIGPVVGAVTSLRSTLISLGANVLADLLDRLADGSGFQSFLTNLGLSDGAAAAITGTLRSVATIVREGAGLFMDIGRQVGKLVAPLLEVARGFGEMLAPHLAFFADFAATKVLPAIRDIVAWLGPQLQGAIRVVGPLLTGLVDLGLSVVQLALQAIATTWDLYLKPAFEALSKWLGDLTGGWDQLARGAEKLGKLLSDVAQAIRDIASGKVDFGQVFSGFNNLISGNIQLPGFASGVQDFGGGLAYVHAGELLVNMSRGTDVIPAPQASRMLGGRSAGVASGGAAPVIVNLTVQGSVVTERNLIDAVQRGLVEKGRRTNGGPLGERT